MDLGVHYLLLFSWENWSALVVTFAILLVKKFLPVVFLENWDLGSPLPSPILTVQALVYLMPYYFTTLPFPIVALISPLLHVRSGFKHCCLLVRGSPTLRKTPSTYAFDWCYKTVWETISCKLDLFCWHKNFCEIVFLWYITICHNAMRHRQPRFYLPCLVQSYISQVL